MKRAWILAAAVAMGLASSGAASAADTKVAIGISGWTGFAPLTLAKEAGIFKKHGLDVTVAKVPQASRHLALASGDIQCAATTVETWIVWNAAGVATTQIFQLDVSHGADGIAVKPGIDKIADLKGKAVAASAPGTSPYFLLAWILAKNGMTTKDVKIVNMEPGPAAQALLAGQNDAAVTYEPYLSSVRSAPDKGKIIATTLDYPVVMDTFGCTTGFLKDHPDAAKALAASYYEALDMIKTDKDKAFDIMGKDVKQSGKEFGESAEFLQWQDKAAALKFFGSEFKSFNDEAADLLLSAGVIKAKPDLSKLADTQFIQ
jgi:NitT/TauT family transport system substrate-binding protein